ncbi:hypothetical protein ES703_46407 [subsurface metagenome]
MWLYNPLLEEGFSIFFSNKKALRAYLIYVVLIGAVLFLWWPKTPISYFLDSNLSPGIFTTVLIFSFLLMAWLSALFGIEGYVRDEFHLTAEWLGMTPLSPGRILRGKLALFVLHTGFLAILPLPFLIIAASPSGISLRILAACFIVALVCALTYRIIGFFFLLVMEKRPFLMYSGLWGTVILAVLSKGFLPKASPVEALLSLIPQGEQTYPRFHLFGLTAGYFMYALTYHLLISLIISLLSFAWIIFLRSKLKGSSK